jgi:phage gpG-like protein
MGAFTLFEFAVKLTAASADMRLLAPEIIRAACEIVAAAARDMIGIPKPEWPALNPETLARKIANTPLLETGAMRDSIQWNSDEHDGYVGSNSKILQYQEFGTARGVPPRPVLGLAVLKKEKEIEKMAARAVMSVLRGMGTNSSEIAEIVRLLREIGHLVKETATGRQQREAALMTPKVFEARALKVIADIALFNAFEPEDRVRQSLEALRAKLAGEYVAAFPGVAKGDLLGGVDCILDAIRKRTAEMERDVRIRQARRT